MSDTSSHLVSFSGHEPRLGRAVYVAPGARLVGDVVLGDRVSVWFNAVLRGDIHHVHVGDGTNIQDNCTLHVDDDFPCEVGRDVVVGHAAVLHGCTVEDDCLIGMGAIVLNGACIGRGSVVAAGTLVPQGREIPPAHLVMGLGAKRVQPLPDGFWDAEPQGAAKYRRLAEAYVHGRGWAWPDPEWEAADAEEIRRRRPPGPDASGGEDRRSDTT